MLAWIFLPNGARHGPGAIKRVPNTLRFQSASNMEKTRHPQSLIRKITVTTLGDSPVTNSDLFGGFTFFNRSMPRPQFSQLPLGKRSHPKYLTIIKEVCQRNY